MEMEKINQVQTYILTNNITELNELIYAGAKSVGEKIRFPSKRKKKKIKTWMRNTTGNADKKSTKTGQNDKTKQNKTKKKHWNM